MVFAAEIATQHLEPLGSASGYAEEIRPILSSLALFEGFSESECAAIFDYMACYGAASNTTILQEGDVGDFLIMVLTGRMDVLKADATGESKVVRKGGFDLDSLKLALVGIVIAAGVYGNAYFRDQSVLYRALALIALAVVCGFIGFNTARGRAAWARPRFVGARVGSVGNA